MPFPDLHLQQRRLQQSCPPSTQRGTGSRRPTLLDAVILYAVCKDKHLVAAVQHQNSLAVTPTADRVCRTFMLSSPLAHNLKAARVKEPGEGDSGAKDEKPRRDDPMNREGRVQAADDR